MLRLAWALVGLTAACDISEPEDPTQLGLQDTAPVVEAPADERATYHASIRPIIEAQCISCHHSDGIAPFDMTWRADEWTAGAPAWTRAAAAAVAAGTMPPWKPAAGCHPMLDERRLSAEQLDLFAQWADQGFMEGDPAHFIPPVSTYGQIDRAPDLHLTMLEPFTPDITEPDDYQCFVLDYDGTTERWLSAIEVLPGQRKMAHHAILYQLDEGYADDVAAWDAADPRPGYNCLFDPGTWDSAFLAGWAPGEPPIQLPEGTARQIPAGSKLVLQMHYNTHVLSPEEPVPADESAVRLWFLPEGQAPSRELVAIPFPVEPYIPAGDPDVVASMTIKYSDFLYGVPPELIELFEPLVDVVGVFPHMHQLGTRITTDILHEDGTEECLFDIPDWDFAWQQGYFFTEEGWYSPGLNHSIRLTCEYDNSAENQPIIGGVQGEPRDVYWGEGTQDEMCLVFLETLLPVGIL